MLCEFFFNSQVYLFVQLLASVRPLVNIFVPGSWLLVVIFELFAIQLLSPKRLPLLNYWKFNISIMITTPVYNLKFSKWSQNSEIFVFEACSSDFKKKHFLLGWNLWLGWQRVFITQCITWYLGCELVRSSWIWKPLCQSVKSHMQGTLLLLYIFPSVLDVLCASQRLFPSKEMVDTENVQCFWHFITYRFKFLYEFWSFWSKKGSLQDGDIWFSEFMTFRSWSGFPVPIILLHSSFTRDKHLIRVFPFSLTSITMEMHPSGFSSLPKGQLASGKRHLSIDSHEWMIILFRLFLFIQYKRSFSNR